MNAFFRALLLVFLAAPAAATTGHDVDVTGVARVFLDEIDPGRYLLSVVDRQVPPIVDPASILPDGCAPLEAEVPGLRIGSGFAFACEGGLDLADRIVLPWSLAGVVVLARWADGTETSAYFRGAGGAVEVSLASLGAEAGSGLRLLRDHFMLGVEHILFGIDHLLFVLGLLLLVRGTGTLVATITAFTVAHSATLGAAVLGAIPVAPGPVEAAIALSVVLLAREIVAEGRGERHLVHRFPWLVAFGFGLLHGFGFAGALGEMGLHPADIPSALLAFNVGVEAGQLAFVAALLLVRRGLPRNVQRGLPALRPALGFALGAVATFWFLERLPAVWGA